MAAAGGAGARRRSSRSRGSALDARGLAHRLRRLAEHADHLDRTVDVRLAGEANAAVLPAFAHERERLQEPHREGEFLELRRRAQVLGARYRDDRARRAEAVAAAPLPESRLGLVGRVPEPVALPDVDGLAVDHAAHALARGCRIGCHGAKIIRGERASLSDTRAGPAALPPPPPSERARES